MTRVEWSSIGHQIVSRIDICMLSSRDKVQLFQFLLEDLGINRRLQEEAEATERAQQIMIEQFDIFWDMPTKKA